VCCVSTYARLSVQFATQAYLKAVGRIEYLCVCMCVCGCVCIVHEYPVCRQVVICGAVPSMVRSVRLYNDCSSSDVRVDMKGRVLADDDKSDRFRKSVCLRLSSELIQIIFGVECIHHKIHIYNLMCFVTPWSTVLRSPSQEIPLPVWNPEVGYCVTAICLELDDCRPQPLNHFC